MNQSIFRSKWMYKKQICSIRLNCLANTLRMHVPRKCERKMSRTEKTANYDNHIIGLEGMCHSENRVFLVLIAP